MLLGKRDYSMLVEKIHGLFTSCFGEDLLLVKKQEAHEHSGYFKIQYKYLPLEYEIVFESEFDVFCINISDREGAKNSLYRIIRFENETTIENIKNATFILKSILEANDFPFYAIRDGKLYKKEKCEYKRVKDLTELTSGL